MQNKEFEQSLIEYVKYSDSSGYNNDLDYIIIVCSNVIDTICFSFSQAEGAYSMIYYNNGFIDFLEYDKHKILLVGSYPNDIVKVYKNQKIDLINGIIRRKYPKDYEKYLIDPHYVQPILNDKMEMVLKFHEGEKIYCKRNYF